MKNSLQAIGICGSLRKNSWNRKLLEHCMKSFSAHGIGSQILSASETELPLLNEDLEVTPLEAKVLSMREKLEQAKIVVIASPEYNASPSAALKNLIDWGTRPPANLWEGKIVLLASASPGSLGGARGLIHLRAILSGVKAWVIPEQVQCASADKVLDKDLEAPFLALINSAVEKTKLLADKLS